MDYSVAEPRDGGVYALVNTENGKLYIGSAVRFRRRWAVHVNRLKEHKHSNPHLQSAWDLYGESSFEWRVLEIVVDPTTLCLQEQGWIDRMGVCDPLKGYNILRIAGSRLGQKASEETRRKLREAQKRRVHPGYLTDEHRAALSASRTGQKWTDKQRTSIMSALDAKEYTPEELKLRAERVAGEKNPFFGKTHPPERKEMMRKASAYGRHVRWHISRDKPSDSCAFCLGTDTFRAPVN